MKKEHKTKNALKGRKQQETPYVLVKTEIHAPKGQEQ